MYLKIDKILLILIIVMGANKIGNSQTNYTDIVPDTILDNLFENFEFDIDNDGQKDFDIWLLDAGSGCNSVEFIGNNSNCQAQGFLLNGKNYAYAYQYGTIMDTSQGNWITFYYFLNNCGLYGEWIDVTDHYLSLRKKINDEWHYGWLRVDVDSLPSKVTIKSYAVNLIPNETIIAGDTSNISDIRENYPNKIDIIIEDKYLKVTGANLNKIDKITIINCLGQITKVYSLSKKNQVIELSSLNPGIYIISVSGKNFIQNKKVFIRSDF